MKRGHKRLLIFELFLYLFFVLNSFVINVLGSYSTIIFLIIAIILFKYLFGLEKDRHRYTKDIIFDILIFLLIYFLLYYLFGILIGFAKTDNYYNINGIVKFIIPIIGFIIFKEILRYQVVSKAEGSKLLTVLSTILFIFLDITTSIYYGIFNSNYEIFVFIALTILPAITTNIACSYIALRSGYKPNIVYLLIINLYQYLIPLVPDPNEYLASIINFLLPIALLVKIIAFYKKERDEEVSRDYNKSKLISLLIPAALVVVIVYFTSGYFHYQAVAIASGSMEPKISKGDVVIVEKIDGNYKQLKKGQVIAYNYNGIIVVHRLDEIIKEDNDYYFYTKGDANKERDNYIVEKEMILGTVNFKIPFLGIPTVWLNEL